MYIDGLFIDRAQPNYDGFITVHDRQSHQERLAEELYFKHLRKIKQSNVEPVFFIDRVESKMQND